MTFDSTELCGERVHPTYRLGCKSHFFHASTCCNWKCRLL